MELQIALDRMPANAALDVVAAVTGDVDWIEVGTSMVKRYGADFIEQVVATAAGTPVLVDLKTADDARWEFSMAYAAGARSATVLGLAPRATIDAAVAIAAEHGREVVVDLMGLDDPARTALAAGLPDHVVLAAHVSKDLQSSGASPLDQLGDWAVGRAIAVAGGLGAADVALVADRDIRVIVGSAVTKSPDPRVAVRDLLDAVVAR